MSELDLRRITEEVARDPGSWPLFREKVREAFDRSAECYGRRLGSDHVAPLLSALRRLTEPRRVLDVGCGTGVGSDVLAQSFPSAWIVGVDLSFGMIRVAEGKRRPRPMRFLAGDAASLPFADGSFDLIVMVAVPLFAREMSRVLGAGGTAIASFPLGEATPIFLPSAELERQFRSAGLEDLDHGRAGRGTFTVARKPRSNPGESASRHWSVLHCLAVGLLD